MARDHFPLEVDTGAAATTISTGLAKQLGLKKLGEAETSQGAGCTRVSQNYTVRSWSLEGVALKGQTINSTNGPDMGNCWPRGWLGADVLSRLAAVRLDFTRQIMTVVTPAASASALDSKFVKQARLNPIDEPQAGTTFCSRIVVPEYSSGPWEMDGHRVTATVFGATPRSSNSGLRELHLS